jgi:hypothetical protein
VTTFGDLILSPEHEAMLVASLRAEKEEERERERRQEEHLQRCIQLAAQAHPRASARDHFAVGVDEIFRSAAAGAAREDGEFRREAERRAAEAEDRRTALIMSGARPRTVAEVLRTAAGIAG